VYIFQSNLAVDFIKGYSGDQPFLMVLAPPAPHAPFTPADRHNGVYNDTKAKRTPNFNVPVHQVVAFVQHNELYRIFSEIIRIPGLEIILDDLYNLC